eukprot:maker-scaffold67_size430214-snap-gene-3.35 protein:Tk00795 transcript:maker-scaffold67_size430214-snap-gene-3.35-mRNA-1 annotation:"unnamed protein product"
MVAWQSSSRTSGESVKENSKQQSARTDPNDTMEQGGPTIRSPRSTSDPDFLVRPAWYNARTALSVVRKGKATGNKPALWLRAKMQEELYALGHFIQIHAGKVLFVGFLVFVVFCVGLKSARIESKIENLWVEGKRSILHSTAELGHNIRRA